MAKAKDDNDSTPLSAEIGFAQAGEQKRRDLGWFVQRVVTSAPVVT